jgi:L-lactate dehydrogenase complex protein LldF
MRRGLGLWAWAARRPALYRMGARVANGALRLIAGRRGRIRSLPFAGGWTGQRDFPAPQGRTFMDQWKG